MRKETIFLFFLSFFILGIVIGASFSFTQAVILGFFVFALFLLIKKEKIALFFLIVLLIGVVRAQIFAENINSSPLINFNKAHQGVKIQGVIIREPEFTKRFQKLVLKTSKVQGRKIKAKILIYTDKDKEFLKGQILFLFGKLREPSSFNNFNYKEYLRKKGIVSIIYHPEIKTIRETNWFYKTLANLKSKSRKVCQDNLPYPENYLLRAIILGDKKELPDELKESFNKAGVRHITAISGMHITILLDILMSIFFYLGLRRRWAGLAAILFVSLYIIFIGMQPSAIRAAVIGSTLILAQVLGRMPDAVRALLFVAAIMVCINPFFIYDIGFQLSFLAALGINYLASFLNRSLRRIFKPKLITGVLAITFSAQIFTLPLLLYHFGYFALLSPVSNVLVVPLIPLIIGLGFLGILIGLISSWLSFLIFAPLFLLLAYIVAIANFISRFSVVSINFHISFILVALYYLSIAFFIRRLYKKQQFWFLEY